ncbi:MAG: hypothetical protein KA713_16720 [Chryseotalea sp. WA131a]|nr:MAG: hypothetical protein KA713_16720 [Chryseotalea sp. WA131a]
MEAAVPDDARDCLNLMSPANFKGRIIAKVTPEEVSKNPASFTGKFLRLELE